jgi:hypothetical protein
MLHARLPYRQGAPVPLQVFKDLLNKVGVLADAEVLRASLKTLGVLAHLQPRRTQSIATVFNEYVEKHSLDGIAKVFAEGMKVEVGDAVPSADYSTIVADVPELWEKAFEVNAAKDPAVRASCIEFILAGLYATERISRIQSHGHTIYDTRGYA